MSACVTLTIDRIISLFVLFPTNLPSPAYIKVHISVLMMRVLSVTVGSLCRELTTTTCFITNMKRCADLSSGFDQQIAIIAVVVQTGTPT